MPPRKKKNDETRIEVTDRASKLKAIEQLTNKINAGASDNVLYYDTRPCDAIGVYSTRIPSLDIATGVGGIPKNRITEIFGPERSGKTTVALQIAAVAQQQGDIILYVDAEHALEEEYCRALGLDPLDPSFLIMQPEFGEQGLDAVLKFLDQKLVDLVIIDSLASLLPKATLDAIMNDTVAIQRVGEKARMLTKFIESAVSLVNRSDSTLLLLQQMRTKITSMGAYETTASPLAVKHEESLRIEIRKVKDEAKGNASDETLAGSHQVSKAKVVKNKVSKPFRQSIFDVVYGVGADYAANLLATCAAKGLPDVVYGAQKWVSIVDTDTGEILGKFRQSQSKEWLDGHQETAIALNDKLSALVGINLYDPYNPGKVLGPIDVPDDISSIESIEEVCPEQDTASFGEPIDPDDQPNT